MKNNLERDKGDKRDNLKGGERIKKGWESIEKGERTYKLSLGGLVFCLVPLCTPLPLMFSLSSSKDSFTAGVDDSEEIQCQLKISLGMLCGNFLNTNIFHSIKK